MAAQNRVGSSRGLACARLFVRWHHPRFSKAVPFWGRDGSLGAGQAPLQPSAGYSWPSRGYSQPSSSSVGQQHSDSFSLHRHVPAAGARVPRRCSARLRPHAWGHIVATPASRSWHMQAGMTGRQPSFCLVRQWGKLPFLKAVSPLAVPSPRLGAAPWR